MNSIYLLIDGENIDATLGVNILKRFPRGDERPRWDRVLRFNPWRTQREHDFSQSPVSSCPVSSENLELEHLSETPHTLSETSSNLGQIADDSRPITPAIFAHQTDLSENSEAVNKNEQNTVSPTAYLQKQGTEPQPAAQTTSSVTPQTTSSEAALAVETGLAELRLETQQSGSLASKNGLFFLNASQRVATTFVQALLAIGWHPILLTSEDPELKIVDIGIQKTLEAIAKDRPGSQVILASHDVDYLEQLETLLDAGHQVAVMCFREYLAMPIAELEARGLKIIDLEYDVNAFNLPLSRVSPIAIEDFDPYQFI